MEIRFNCQILVNDPFKTNKISALFDMHFN